MALLEAGFADRLMFSSDASRGYGKTLTAFLPKLKAVGAGDEVLSPDHGGQSAPVSRVRAKATAQAIAIYLRTW